MKTKLFLLALFGIVLALIASAAPLAAEGPGPQTPVFDPEARFSAGQPIAAAPPARPARLASRG